MKREAIVIKASVNESLPNHLFESEIEKYRDVWFSVLARYKKNSTFKCLRVPISRDADSVDISFLQNYIAKKTKIKADNVLFKNEPILELLMHNITVREQ
jgi:hypothetical protein